MLLVDLSKVLLSILKIYSWLSLFVIRNIILVRADISRLPFATSSVDAVHAGAALHCWPSPSTAVSTYLHMVLKLPVLLAPATCKA